jgi:N-acetylglucosaminyldiphosphoundecaprenol N-acetyl-beta-D-mannosaminyltransferase
LFTDLAVMKTLTLFDLPIANVTLQEAVCLILKYLAGDKTARISFVNAHCINVSRRDEEYRQILRESTAIFADGVGMKLAALLHGDPLRDNVNGTDLYPLLLTALEDAGYRIFLLGAEPGVSEEMRRRALEKHPDLTICGTHHGFFSPEENAVVVQKIREANADLLMAAMGVPQQEKWIAANAEAAGVKVAIGVGGLFNFYSGSIPRAPAWMRKSGLEWAHRLWMEPGRLWKRYLLGNAQFMGWAVWERIRKKREI